LFLSQQVDLIENKHPFNPIRIDLPAIEAEMKKIAKENLKFSVFELPRAEAVKLMEERGEKYKVEHIGDLAEVRLANFSFSKVTSRVAKLRAGERINIFDPAMSAGALMDIGVYCVAPAIALFGEPEHVCAVGVTAEVPGCDEGDPCRLIDLSGVIALGYPDMAVSLTFGKVSDDKIACQVQGEDATLVWDQVSCPENLRVYDHEDKGMLFRLETGEGRRIDVAPPEHDMSCEIQAFVDGVRGKRDLSRFREITLGTLRVMAPKNAAPRVLTLRNAARAKPRKRNTPNFLSQVSWISMATPSAGRRLPDWLRPSWMTGGIWSTKLVITPEPRT